MSWGKVLDYLGITLDFTKPGEVTITMINYIKSILHNAPKEMCGHAVTLATNHLFEVNNTNPMYLNTDKTEIYVHLVMQLLFLSQHACPDIHNAVSFLNSWLLQPNEDDYKKLI